jgi:hypothetical protein
MSDLSTIGWRYNGANMEFFDQASGNTLFAYRSAAADLAGPIVGMPVDNITAKAGGGQGTATPITGGINRVTTVASAADSVKLPVSVAGMQLDVINAAAGNAMNVYPQTGEAIDVLATNSAFSVAANKVARFYCVTAGQWHSILTA